MCGRFALAIPRRRVAEAVGLPGLPEVPDRYNIAPTQLVEAVSADRHDTNARTAKIGAEPEAFNPFRNLRGVIAFVSIVPAVASAAVHAASPAVIPVSCDPSTAGSFAELSSWTTLLAEVPALSFAAVPSPVSCDPSTAGSFAALSSLTTFPAAVPAASSAADPSPRTSRMVRPR